MSSGDWPVYDFDYVHDCSVIELRQRLGSKGAGLVEMRQQLGLPVPHGFVLGAALCRPFLASGWLDGLDQAISVGANDRCSCRSDLAHQSRCRG